MGAPCCPTLYRAWTRPRPPVWHTMCGRIRWSPSALRWPHEPTCSMRTRCVLPLALPLFVCPLPFTRPFRSLRRRATLSSRLRLQPARRELLLCTTRAPCRTATRSPRRAPTPTTCRSRTARRRPTPRSGTTRRRLRIPVRRRLRLCRPCLATWRLRPRRCSRSKRRGLAVRRRAWLRARHTTPTAPAATPTQAPSSRMSSPTACRRAPTTTTLTTSLSRTPSRRAPTRSRPITIRRRPAMRSLRRPLACAAVSCCRARRRPTTPPPTTSLCPTRHRPTATMRRRRSLCSSRSPMGSCCQTRSKLLPTHPSRCALRRRRPAHRLRRAAFRARAISLSIRHRPTATAATNRRRRRRSVPPGASLVMCLAAPPHVR
jgi:hypothetical protein